MNNNLLFDSKLNGYSLFFGCIFYKMGKSEKALFFKALQDLGNLRNFIT